MTSINGLEERLPCTKIEMHRLRGDCRESVFCILEGDIWSLPQKYGILSKFYTFALPNSAQKIQGSSLLIQEVQKPVVHPSVQGL